MAHDVCIVLGLSLVFLVFFLLCVDRKKRFIIFILSQQVSGPRALGSVSHLSAESAILSVQNTLSILVQFFVDINPIGVWADISAVS